MRIERKIERKTTRRSYEWLIGYDFGTDGYYNGKYYDDYTKRVQYEFILPNGSSYITDYNGFREVIDRYDLPKH